MRQYLAMFVMLLIAGLAPMKTPHIPNGAVYSEPTELERFMKHMARRESNNTPTAVNKYGMMGKYQFDPRTVQSLGFRIEKTRFLRDPLLQDSVMVAYMRANNQDLAQIINRFEGKVYKGVRVTRAGIIAAAHLVGSGNVRRYFADASDQNGRTDANGTSLRDYLSEFNKYNLQASF